MSINFKVDETKCIHCGLCIKDCMPHIFYMNEDKIPTVNTQREKNCLHCQHCISVCPAGAISVLGKNPEDSSTYKNEFNSDEILELIKERKSVRHYKHQNVEPEIIQKLKDMLKYVPTGVNNHKLHFAFVEDLESMDKLREKVNTGLIKHFEENKEEARKFLRYLKQIKRGNDIIFRYAPHAVVVSNDREAPCKDADPIIALSYFELYAKSLGLGTCWSGLAYYSCTVLPELKEIFRIPETHDVQYVMIFGYPEFNYKRSTQPDNYQIETIRI